MLNCSSCIDCSKRNSVCHITCISYAAYLLFHAGEVEVINKEKAKDADIISYMKSMKKRGD